jgi:hypothetical protein
MGVNLTPGKNDLESQFPALAREFDLKLNAPLTPSTVMFGSGKSVYWKCPQGHSYLLSINARTATNQNCPICANKRVLAGYNDLESQRPEVASEWDYEANAGLTPSEVYFRSTRKVFWQCREGHSFKSAIRSRTERGTGCSVCANLVVLKGFNDLATTHPELAAEWDHDANGTLSPSDVVSGSERKVFWRCEKGHSYVSIPYNRLKGSGCTVCSGQMVQRGFNDLASTRPDIAEEWDDQKNGDVTPQHVTAGSNKKYLWLCPQGHSYRADVAHRSAGKGCPYCAGQKVLVGFNDFPTTHPELAKRWDYTKNAPLMPEQFSMGATKKVYWLCERGHSHLGGINSKANGNGCPVCADQQVLAGYNDLGTLYPEIAAEWDYKKNAPVTPRDVLRGTARKYFWLCSAGHSFQQSVLSRTGGGQGCPRCAKYGYDSTRPGILYFIKNEKLRARKIGITNRETGIRYDRIRSYGSDWQVIQTFTDEDGYRIKRAEFAVLEWIRKTAGLGQFLTRQDMGSGGGHTETFSIDGPSDSEVLERILLAMAEASGEPDSNPLASPK